VIVMPVFPLKTRRNLHAVIGCGLAALLFTAAPARAQQDETAPEVKIIDGIMGAIGLKRGGDEAINYRERSPLVIPPTVGGAISTETASTLQAPQTDNVADPNWPVDPEVKEARALAAAQKKSDGRTSSQIMDDNMRPFSRSELEKGRSNRAQNNANNGDRSLERSSWSELGYKGGLFGNMFGDRSDSHVAFTGEPPRSTLTAPPVGYQTPSPTQPYAQGGSAYRDKAIDPYADRKYEK
jgi:hypothetical protein